MERESMEFDVVIVGAGPSGLATACKLLQLAQEKQQELSVCVVEKGSEVGAHILSGAILEPTALNELFPDWQSMGAPLNTPVVKDEMLEERDAYFEGHPCYWPLYWARTKDAKLTFTKILPIGLQN